MNELHKACAAGQLPQIIQLLAAGHDINALHTDLGTSPLCFALESGHVEVAAHLFRCGAKIVIGPDLVGNESVFTWVNECRDATKRKELLTWLQNNASNPDAFRGACPFTLEQATFALSLATKNKKQRFALCRTLQPGNDALLRLAGDHFRMEVHQMDAKLRAKAEEEKCVLALEMLDKVSVKTAADFIIQERIYFFLITNKLVRDDHAKLFSFKYAWVKCMDALQKLRKFDDDDFIPLAYNLHSLGLHFTEQNDDLRHQFLRRAVLTMQQVVEESDENCQSLGTYSMDYAESLSGPENDKDIIAHYRIVIKVLEKIRKMTAKNKHMLANAYANLADKLDDVLEEPTKNEKSEIEDLFSYAIKLLNQLLSDPRENNDGYHRSLGRASYHFAGVLYRFKKPNTAIPHYRACIKAMKSIRHCTVEDVSTLVKAHRDFGALLSEQGKDVEGVEQHKLAMALCRDKTSSVYVDIILSVAAEMVAIYSDKSKNFSLDHTPLLNGLACSREAAELGIDVYEEMDEKDEQDEQNYFTCLEFLSSYYQGRKEHRQAVQCFQRALKIAKEPDRVTTLHVWLAYAHFELSQFSLGFDSVEKAIFHANKITDLEPQYKVSLEFLSFANDYCNVRKDKAVSYKERVVVFASSCFGKEEGETCVGEFFILYCELTNAASINQTMINAYALLKRLMTSVIKLADEDSLLLNEGMRLYLKQEKNKANILSLLQVDLVKAIENPHYFSSKVTLFDKSKSPLANSGEISSYARMGKKRSLIGNQ